MALLEQLQQLAPLAAAATAGPWQYGSSMELSQHEVTQNFIYQDSKVSDDDEWNNAAFIAAARNLLTPENLPALCAALAPQWVAVNGDGGPCDPMLEEEFLYVELPDGRVVQAMYTECNYQPEHTEIGESYAWGHYTEVDHMEPLPVQPVRYFTPPTTTKGAGHV